MASASNPEQAAPSSRAPSWWTLDAEGQHVGPYSAADLAGTYAAQADLSSSMVVLTGHVATGQMAAEALVWAEGQPEWQPIKAISELQRATAAAGADSAGAYEIVARGAQQGSKPAAAVAVAAAAPTTAEAGQDAELAAFQAELADIDPEAAAALDPTGPGASERVSTPPPEDRRFEDDDGTVYIWDGALRKFVQAAVVLPAYDEAEMTFEPEEEKIPAMPQNVAEDEEERDPEDGDGPASTSQANGAQASASTDAVQQQQQGAGPSGRTADGRGTTAADVIAKHAERGKRARDAEGKGSTWFDLKVNTSVYVTGLPDDVTEAELAEVFTKCGVIKEGDDKMPRVKIYRDKALGDVAKGDGLITYLKEPSVDLACRILDGAQLRPGMGIPMTVQPAKFEMHGQEYKPRKKGANKRQKKVAAQAEEKALGWGGFDDQLKATEVTVILLHLFDPAELQEQADLEKELESDITSECGKMGPVQKVRIYSYNPQGAVSVRFKTPEAAGECVTKMKGRFFGGRQLDAFRWDGITNYMVKKPKAQADEEDQARLDAYASSLEQGTG